MTSQIKPIAIEKLLPHPANPNRMSKASFDKLVRNIERTGRYEPLVVRPHPKKDGFYQIINGQHRRQALKKLGCKTANAVIWDIDDSETHLLLATLNRLVGKDILEKKLSLLHRLNKKLAAGSLAKFLPQTAKQIEKLTTLKLPTSPVPPPIDFVEPMVFFVSGGQKKIVEEALSLAEKSLTDCPTRAERKAAALTAIAQSFLAARTCDEIRQFFKAEFEKRR
jgi:ParB/RepB/Spo0J family partition protein